MCRNWSHCLYLKASFCFFGYFLHFLKPILNSENQQNTIPRRHEETDYFLLVMSLHKIISTFLYVWIKKSCRMLWIHKCKATGGCLPWSDDVPFETTCRKLSVSLKVGMATEAGLFFYSGTYRWTISAQLWNPEKSSVEHCCVNLVGIYQSSEASCPSIGLDSIWLLKMWSDTEHVIANWDELQDLFFSPFTR